MHCLGANKLGLELVKGNRETGKCQTTVVPNGRVNRNIEISDRGSKQESINSKYAHYLEDGSRLERIVDTLRLLGRD